MTEQRIREMDRQEVIFRAYDLTRSDMAIACFESDEETLTKMLWCDTEDLKLYLENYIDCMEDTDTTMYRGYEIIRDVLEGYGEDMDGTVEYGVHEDVGKDSERYLWFYTFAEAIDYINEEVA